MCSRFDSVQLSYDLPLHRLGDINQHPITCQTRPRVPRSLRLVDGWLLTSCWLSLISNAPVRPSAAPYLPCLFYLFRISRQPALSAHSLGANQPMHLPITFHETNHTLSSGPFHSAFRRARDM